jgi:hypothetical protein
MKTWDSYKTETDLDGYAILGRVHDALLDSPDCRYNVKDKSTPANDANWEARVSIVGLRFSFPHVQAVLSGPETSDEVTTGDDLAPAKDFNLFS